ncbi:MAG: nucleotidyltransferase domain-containing protein [Acidimicrobiales bacterium]
MVDVDLDLRPERRTELAGAIASALRTAVPGSDVALRGSLATGKADPFSDIDLLWAVPVPHVVTAVEAVAGAMSTVAPVASIRSDPDLEGSTTRRLLFIRLTGVPLFWRVDLEVQASLPDESQETPPTPMAAPEWSKPASALANAVAAVKAVLRGQLLEARGLLERGFERIGAPYDPHDGWTPSVRRLSQAVADADPALADLAAEVEALALALLPH